MTPFLLGLALLNPGHSDGRARAACSAPAGMRPDVPGIAVEAVAASGGDLPYLRITDRKSGGWMKAYYDAASAGSAWARAACLGAQIRMISDETGQVWRNGQWYSVTVAGDPAYIPPRDTSDHRWTIQTRPDGTLDPASQTWLVVTMPHEQVHAFQTRAGAKLPRWVEEGHAEWISRKITAQLAPAEGAANARRYAEALAASTTPIELGKWGGVSVKREAILRQASPEDRRRMEAEPSFMPPGPYKLGPGDLVSDESNMTARYEAAYRVFRSLEATYGAARVQRWAGDLTSVGGTVTPERIEETGRAAFREDLGVRLQ